MSDEIEKCVKDEKVIHDLEASNIASSLQKFELEVILQTMYFQRSQKKMCNVVANNLYYKSLEFCFPKVHEAVNYIKAILKA